MKSKAQGTRSARATQLKASILLLVQDTLSVRDVADNSQHGAHDAAAAYLDAGHGTGVDAQLRARAEHKTQLHALAVDALLADDGRHGAAVQTVVRRCGAVTHRCLGVHDTIANVVVV